MSIKKINIKLLKDISIIIVGKEVKTGQKKSVGPHYCINDMISFHFHNNFINSLLDLTKSLFGTVWRVC